MTLVRTEEQEQVALVHWLDVVGLKYTAIPNSTFSKHWSVKARNTRMGVRRGFPDLVVVIPPERSYDKTGRLVCIELKRIKGGVTSPEQKEWIAALNDLDSPNVVAGVCKGFEEARQVIQSYMKTTKQGDEF